LQRLPDEIYLPIDAGVRRFFPYGGDMEMKPGNLLLIILLFVLAASFAGTGTLCAQEKGGNPMVLVKTSMGSFKIELFTKEAPISVKNFLNYVDKKFYDGTIFHRVMPGFVIQGGGFDKNMVQKSTLSPIQNEAKNGLKNLRGTLSMARTPDINSATSQFFVNLKNNASLDHTSDAQPEFGYAVFAKVVQGMDVIDKIAAVATGNKGPHQNVPVKPIVIESMTRVVPEKAAESTPAPAPKK
jgi:peptidyl-prolyl cis-trans isomerase A (cyclophilin A)